MTDDQSNILFIGGSIGKMQFLSDVYLLENPTASSMLKCPFKMSTERRDFGLCRSGSRAYVCGGYDGNEHLKTVEFLSTVVDDSDSDSNGFLCWQPVTNLHYPRSLHGCVSIDEQIVVVGGQTDQHVLKSVEMFNKESNNWRSLTPMQEARHSAAVVAHNDSIYVFGGRNGLNNSGKVLKTVEKLTICDSSNSQWKTIGKTVTGRVGAVSCVYNGFIYIIGGNNGLISLSSTEIFNPNSNSSNSNTTTSNGPDLNIARSYASVIIYCNQLYIFGGETDNFEPVTEIETLEDSQWKIVGGVGEDFLKMSQRQDVVRYQCVEVPRLIDKISKEKDPASLNRAQTS
eukprot:Platyproteum_vivax@DN8406_c0_g1_i1.p1